MTSVPPRTVRRVGAMAVAVAGAAWIQVGPQSPRAPDTITPVLDAMAPLRAHLSSHARVGFVVGVDPAASYDDLVDRMLAQYALAPARVEAVVFDQCRSGPACDPGRFDVLVVNAALPGAAAHLARTLDATFVAESRGFVLLRLGGR